MNHREDAPGYQLNLPLQSQSPSLRRPCKGREGAGRERGELVLARVGITFQKWRRQADQVQEAEGLQVPSEVCAFFYNW